MTQLYEKYEGERKKLQAEINRYNIKPISFEVFKKTDEEKGKLLTAKHTWDKMKKKINSNE